MTSKDQVRYGDQISVTLKRTDLPDVILSGTVEEEQPGFYSLAGWGLNDDRVTITEHTSQWLEPPDWKTWQGLSFNGRRFIRVTATLPAVGKLLPGLGTIWRAVDEDAVLTDAQLLAAMQGQRVVRLVLSEVWS